MKTNNTTKPPAAISVKEFSRRTGLSPYRLRRMIARGQLEVIQVLQRRMVLSHELRRFGLQDQ
jgi:hypothetical protein